VVGARLCLIVAGLARRLIAARGFFLLSINDAILPELL
jgi:hypothetical protein